MVLLFQLTFVFVFYLMALTCVPSGNLAHKANECNIFFEDFFCDYCEKEGHQEAVCFAKFLEWKQL